MTEQIKSNDEFEDWLEGDYISLKPGETRNLEFKTVSGQIVEERSKFTDKLQKKVLWYVVDVDRHNGKEKKFSISRSHAKSIYAVLKDGHKVLAISRIGSGPKDTKYTVKGLGT